MGNKGKYLEDAILNWIKGTAFPASPSNLYLALFTVAPSDSGGGTEVSGGGYARVAVASNAWSAISSGGSGDQISNSNPLAYPAVTADWGTVLAVGVFDALTVGNLIYWNTIPSRTIHAGDTVQFNAGQVVIAED